MEIPNEHLTNLFLRVLSDLDDDYQYKFAKIMHNDACFFDMNNLMLTQLIRASLAGRSVPEYLRSIPPEASTPVPLKIGKPESPALHLCLGLGDMVSALLSDTLSTHCVSDKFAVASPKRTRALNRNRTQAQARTWTRAKGNRRQAKIAMRRVPLI